MICLKMLQFSCLMILFCVSFSEQYTAFIPQKQHPGKTPYCIDEIEGKKNLDEVWYDLEKCESRHCGQDSHGAVLISINGCGTVSGPDNCKIVRPTDAKAYPECCPRLECEETDKKDE